jgi:hypothetical protein
LALGSAAHFSLEGVRVRLAAERRISRCRDFFLGNETGSSHAVALRDFLKVSRVASSLQVAVIEGANIRASGPV